MIDGLVSGRIHGKPKTGASRNGNSYATAKVRASMADGDSIFVNVIVFADDVIASLLAMDDGDSVALAGTLVPKVWTPQNGEPRAQLDMQAHAVLTAYHINRKRKALQESTDPIPFDDTVNF